MSGVATTWAYYECAQPRSEGFPDKPREDGGEILKQALIDEPGLDEEMIGAVGAQLQWRLRRGSGQW